MNQNPISEAQQEIQLNILPGSQPTQKQNTIVPPSINLSKNLLITSLGFVIVVGSVFIGIQIGKNQTPIQQPIVVQPAASPMQIADNPTASPTAVPTINPTVDWQLYSNTQANFSINYPNGWRKVENTDWVGFGPQEVGGDVVLGVQFYNKSEKTIAQIKDDAGKQFPDRKQTEEAIAFGGLTATKIITTTNQFADWYSVTIIIDNGNMLYVIGNGAQTNTALNEMIAKRTGKESSISFEDFYSSFKITK